MTESERIRRAFLRAFAVARRHAPFDTGNLRHFGMKSSVVGPNQFNIYVDVREAPYMRYTNDPWTNFGPPLRGHINPNEGWWSRAAQAVAISMARDLGGMIT